MKKSILSLAAALLLSLAASAQQSQPIPVDPAVRIGKLDNGLTYYIRHNAEPQGQANFYIAQKVGSILEEEEQRGLAHFLEHMCFNGTKHFPGNGVIKYCESIGVKFGQNLNAYTSIDETVYNIDNVPVGATSSAIDSCLWILHDWADGLLLTDEDIDHERGVIHEEWRTRATAQIRLLEQLLPMMFPVGDEHARPDGTNRYGHRLPIGLMSVVDNFPYKVLRDYYEQWYRPDLQGIVVVGDVDIDAIEAKIKDIFGTIAKPENPTERYNVEVPDNEEPLICMAKDKEQKNSVTYLFCKHDPYPQEMRGDMNYLVYEYAIEAATRMINARLQELLQSEEPPFIGAAVEDGEFFIARTKYSFGGQVVSSEEGLTKAVTTLYREILRAVRNGFTDSEYERAKAQIVANAEAAYNSRDKKKSADYCQEYVRHFIDNEPIAGEENEYAIIQQIASALNAEMVGKIIGQLVKENNLVLTSMLPDKEGVTYPSSEEMTAALKAVAAEQIAPYEETVSDEPLISEMPQPGKVLKTKAFQAGYTQYVLSNGATVYFRQTDFNPNEILMSAQSNGGTSLYPTSMNVDLKALNDVMEVGGLGNFSVTDLRKVLAGRKLSVTPNVSLFGESISASSTPKDFETMLQVNYLYFTSLRSDQKAFESWKERKKAALANQEKDPMTSLQDSIQKTIQTGGERKMALHSNDIDQVNYEHVLQIARERFANAADFTFIITGAIDEATLLPLLEQYIASLPSVGKKEKANMKVNDFAKGKKENTYQRAMEVPMVTNVFFDSGKMKYNLKNKLSFKLALNALSIVLLEEIREKEGGTYGIGAYGDLALTPSPRQQAYLQIPYQTNPDKYEYLNQRVRDIVTQFTTEGPSEENLAKGKEFILKNHKENLRENAYWAGVIDNYLECKQDFSENFEEVLQGITTEDARKIVEQLLKQKNHDEIIMVGVENK